MPGLRGGGGEGGEGGGKGRRGEDELATCPWVQPSPHPTLFPWVSEHESSDSIDVGHLHGSPVSETMPTSSRGGQEGGGVHVIVYLFWKRAPLMVS